MRIRKIAAAIVPLIATATFGAATAHAAPATAPDIGYRTELIGKTVVTTLTHGTFEIAGETVHIVDESGATVVTLPLAVREGTIEYPLPHDIRENDRVLELTAVKDPAAARPATEFVASPQENLAAQNNFASQFGIATAIGGFVGTAIGALVGLTGIVTGPGVVASIIAGATIGGIIGTIAVGGPTLVIAAVELVNTLNAAPGTTQWAPKKQATP
ncbi:ammonium transporter [Nocardia speluncae]|uniref:Ammonium transporter n=1 Tax=Nocardia speluncae TaxID=419477 RepID=A0A846XR12_9NOCA|nr:ammonium transporter [Nocardia speluncae]NKY37685.1 ammonium transporter [Nocardia speluncae]